MYECPYTSIYTYMHTDVHILTADISNQKVLHGLSTWAFAS